VVEQSGRVMLTTPTGDVSPQPFLDIRDKVRAPGDPGAGGEQGLLSIAFHPEYAANGIFYVQYTRHSANGDLRLEEYRRHPADPAKADLASARPVLDFEHTGRHQPQRRPAALRSRRKAVDQRRRWRG
jgi:hypothetical protein